jgi:hypothetical protein
MYHCKWTNQSQESDDESSELSQITLPALTRQASVHHVNSIHKPTPIRNHNGVALTKNSLEETERLWKEYYKEYTATVPQVRPKRKLAQFQDANQASNAERYSVLSNASMRQEEDYIDTQFNMDDALRMGDMHEYNRLVAEEQDRIEFNSRFNEYDLNTINITRTR